MRRQPSFTRAGRVEHLMLGEVERLLAYEVRNPLAQQIKITGGRLSPDLGHLRVQYILHEGGEPFPALEKMLTQTAPFVSRTVQESLQLRGRPQVVFHFDRDSVQLERVRALLAAKTPAAPIGASVSTGAVVLVEPAAEADPPVQH